MTPRTRLTDVADQAAVSTATVSRVLNGRPGVAEATRREVLAALDVLGYERPSSLRQRSAGLVGLIVPELSNPIFPAFAQQIETLLSSSDLTPLLCTQSPGGTTEDDYVEMLLEHGVDGIVFVSGLHADTSADPARYHRLVDRRVPFVLVNGTNPDISAPAFAADDADAMDLAVRHLAAQGHRRIGLAVGPTRFVPVARKIDGFRAAAARYVDDPDPATVSTLFTVEGGRAAGLELLQAGCTAVVAASDLMALGVVRAVRAAGLRVPEDVSVVGYDDSPLMGFSDPPLTTIRQPVPAMCQAAVSTLVAMIRGGSPSAAELTFVPELVVRRSTGAAPPESPAAATASPSPAYPSPAPGAEAPPAPPTNPAQDEDG
ncbi:LacI family DNA-binding transcriptional regulator [Georgenia sp. Z1491]|uniref:LacI family DNA-binding transcriptional regulator n=1 Tax=Georgenia sp. Z1491 TaxID=3416707 RepID=UPI003CEC753B